MSANITRQQLFEQTFNARRELMRSLLFLSESEATGIPLHAGWCVRDVISHIAARECTALAAIRHLVEDGSPGFRIQGDERAFNQGAIDRRREFSLAQVIDELDSIRLHLFQLARRLSPQSLDAQYPVLGQDETRSISDLLASHAAHDYEHAAHIWHWRAQQGLLHRDAFRQALIDARLTLLDALSGLREADMVGIPVCGRWTISQVMAHVLSWDETALRAAKRWAAEPVSEDDMLIGDEWNDAQVRQRADRTVIELADGLATYHRILIQWVNQSSDSQLITMAPAPWGETMTLLSFLYEMACHDDIHTPDLQAAQKRLAVT